MSINMYNPTPGDIVLTEFLEPFGMTPSEFAYEYGISPIKMALFIEGKIRVDVEIDMILCKAFDMGATYFFHLQQLHDERK